MSRSSVRMNPSPLPMDIDNSRPDGALASAQWHEVQADARRDDAGDRVAGLGRWWLTRAAGELVLSAVAAQFLGVERQPARASRLDHVDPADRAAVRTMLDRIEAGLAGVDADPCEFRVRRSGAGVRWLRLQVVGTLAGGAIVAGILVDITAAKQAATRERFNFALTQYLIGADGIDEAVVKILRLVCDELGWEWGAFWALDDGASVLRCRYVWHVPRRALAPFMRASHSLAMKPGQGLIGSVWATGAARWVEDVSTHPHLMRADVARECNLQSAYFFPVTFVASDGRLVRPGVLEFFSEQQRQSDAQLPGLAVSISAMIAQAVERMTQQERIRVRAQTDEMTGLSNRSHFHDLLDDMCDGIAPTDTFGVLYIDLDRFKPINDDFGHEAGNVLLTEFARRLRALAPPGWRVGRLGGDEFALLSAMNADRATIEGVAEAVLDAARLPFAYGERRLTITASIGIAIHPEHGDCTRDLLHAADAAMYISKRKDRG